jgi:asparagine synthetase B (glutamine-hydrolysing)
MKNTGTASSTAERPVRDRLWDRRRRRLVLAHDRVGIGPLSSPGTTGGWRFSFRVRAFTLPRCRDASTYGAGVDLQLLVDPAAGSVFEASRLPPGSS